MIDLSQLGGSSVAVLGIGASGRGTISALRAAGIPAYAWDDGEEGRAAAASLGAIVQELNDDVLAQCRFLVVAPGIPTHYPEPHPGVARARRLNLKIVCDIDLLWRAAPEATYIAITGTNGKSTTTSLIAHILQGCGRHVAAGGNLGPAALGMPMFNSRDDIYVLELSSYQLELCPMARFDHVAYLNLTPDHQTRYANMRDYDAAKQNILRPRSGNHAQSAIIGMDTPETAKVFSEQSGLTPRQFIPVSGQERCMSGISAIGKVLYDDINNLRFDLSTARALPGPHNAQNAAAAYAICLQLGLKPAEIIFNIISFPGLAHRQQYVMTVNGIDIVNDSKATNMDSATKALACYDNIYWIAGGRGQDLRMTDVLPFKNRLQGCYFIGEAMEEMAEWCRKTGIVHTKSETLHNALVQALSDANADRRRPVTVLLSPACKSFDQFKSFEDRGEKFIAMVQAMAAEHEGKA